MVEPLISWQSHDSISTVAPHWSFGLLNRVEWHSTVEIKSRDCQGTRFCISGVDLVFLFDSHCFDWLIDWMIGWGNGIRCFCYLFFVCCLGGLNFKGKAVSGCINSSLIYLTIVKIPNSHFELTYQSIKIPLDSKLFCQTASILVSIDNSLSKLT